MFLYTIGYEGLNTELFLQKIKLNHISTIIDVRELPLSRKPGFSKSSLNELSEFNGIDYVHYRDLGTPRELRKRLHEGDVTYGNYFIQYRNHLDNKTDVVKNAIKIAEESNSVLLCFEHEPRICHRSILAEIMSTQSESIDRIVNL